VQFELLLSHICGIRNIQLLNQFKQDGGKKLLRVKNIIQVELQL